MHIRSTLRLAAVAATCTAAFTFMAGVAAAADLNVELTVKDSGGHPFMVSLYNTPADWLKKPFKTAKVTSSGGAATAVFADLPAGEYAVSAYYDANANGKMDTNFLKIPNEPTGISNNAGSSFGPPTYEQAKFMLPAANHKITVNLR